MERTIIALEAVTSIHAGTGQNDGVIDLPVQREAHTGWPCIFGSSVKGAFRAHAELAKRWEKAEIEAVFGAENAETASSVSMSDARLLLLPVRSLTGHFRLVTCPAILDRLQRDMRMTGRHADWPVPSPEPRQVIGDGSDDIYLEEFGFSQRQGLPERLIRALEGFGLKDDTRLLVMHDDDFAWFARNATDVRPHIAIDNATKTVRSGALWYEESLPPATVLYTLLMGEAQHVRQVAGFAQGEDAFIRIGGNETVGMGWCLAREVA